MFYRSERLLLRPPWPEDWVRVHAAISDVEIVRNLSRAPWPYHADDARQFVNLPIQPKTPRFLLTHVADSAQLIGCIGIDPHGEDVELGYWIARAHWSLGYATEAGRSVLEIAQMLGHRRIVASHFCDNPASGRVLRKLGFEQTGEESMRFSHGRGEEAMVVEYDINLDVVSRQVPMAMSVAISG